VSCISDESHLGIVEDNNVERSTVNTLLLFSILLVCYNALFIPYSFMSFWEDELPSLITFIPLITVLQDMIMTVFTLRYLRLAKTMVKLLASDFQTQIQFLKPESQRRTQLRICALGGVLCFIAACITAFEMYASVCITMSYNNFDHEEAEYREDNKTCSDYMLSGFIADSALKILISGILCYSLICIFYASRLNNKGMREVCCIQLAYLLIVLLQTLLSILLIV